MGEGLGQGQGQSQGQIRAQAQGQGLQQEQNGQDDSQSRARKGVSGIGSGEDGGYPCKRLNAMEVGSVLRGGETVPGKPPARSVTEATGAAAAAAEAASAGGASVPGLPAVLSAAGMESQAVREAIATVQAGAWQLG